MRRIRNCAGFGIWFVGLGYIAIWALQISLPRAAALPADVLPPVLHLAGALAAIAVFIRLLLIALRNSRVPPAGPPPPRRLRRPEPTVKRIQARNHFGLRGLDR